VLGATLAALSAAALFAVATALQHRSAGLVSDDRGSQTDGLAGFVAETLQHPLWLMGTAADVGGLALHALALRDGPLTLVQPLLVSGVVFALPLRQLLEHRRPRPVELAWAAALACGLVLFLVLATPAGGIAGAPDPIPTAISSAVLATGVLGWFVLGRRRAGGAAAVALATSAGLAFAATAGLLKEATNLLNDGVGTLFTTWPIYALLVVGPIGLLVSQLAFQAAPLRFSLPVITTIDPIVSLIIGVAVFDEKFRNGPLYLIGETLGLAMVVAAAVGLTRSHTVALAK
jgi:hypothetical protein